MRGADRPVHRTGHFAPSLQPAFETDSVTDLRFPADRLHARAVAILTACDVPIRDAHLAAECLLAGDQRGVPTHGLYRLGNIVDRLEAGTTNPQPDVTVRSRLPAAGAMDGDNGLGMVLGAHAMDWATAQAQVYGLAMVTVRRSSHNGLAGWFALRAAATGCIGVTGSTTSPAAAPHGARDKLLGTNPLAVGVPAGDRPPFLLDMATTAIAGRRLMFAAERGEQIPEGWALDADGRPTTDAAVARAGGVMLPFGGAKGSGIAFLVEILAGVLSGSRFGTDSTPLAEELTRPRDMGQFYLAIAIPALMDPEMFAARMDRLAAMTKDLRPADGVSEILMPGERGHRAAAEAEAGGVPVSAETVAMLDALAARLGVSDTPLTP